MGTGMIRDGSNDGRWWLMIGLFTLYVVGWSMAFSLKAGASEHGRVADRTWQVRDFDRIAISGSFDVQLEQGDREAVYGNGDSATLDRLEVFVEEHELIVRAKDGGWTWFWESDDVALIIELRDISSLQLSGASDLTVDGLKSTDLALTISGSSDTDIDDLVVRSLELVVSGSADVDLTGQTQNQVVHLSGSTDYSAADFSSASARLLISGSADARIQVRDTLDARISGSGSVRYVGDPEVTRQVSGSGEIRPL